MVTTDPIFSERARAILMRWKQQTCTRSQALLNQWQEIIERKQWEIAVEDSERGRQLRQASPLACLLPHAVRFSIIRKVRALKEAASCTNPIYRALLQNGIVHADTAKSRIPLMPLDAAGKQRILEIMQRLENSLDKP